MPLRRAAFAEKRRYKVGGGAGIFVSHEVKAIEAQKANIHAALVKIKSGQLPFLG
jgi:tmRNA-binding protein